MIKQCLLLVAVLFLGSSCATQEPAKPPESTDACPQGSHATMGRKGKPRCCPDGAICD